MDALYISYWSLKDPLTESQTLPVLRALVDRGVRFALLTFEQAPYRVHSDQVDRVKRQLAEQGIFWLGLRYHKRPRLLATLWDLVTATVRAVGLARKYKIRVFHSRGSIAAAPARLAAKLCGGRFFYDADGPVSQEYLDTGSWAPGSVAYRLTRWSENKCFASADEIAVLTNAYQRHLGVTATVLPCAVNVDRFHRIEDARREIRSRLGVQDEPVLVYAGKFGGWYAIDEMMAFCAALQKQCKVLRLLILTLDDPGHFHGAARRGGFDGVITIRSVTPAEVPHWLSAADCGLSFVRPVPSKMASSPVKNGEYLACGLPVVTPVGIGDYSDLISREEVGVVLRARDGYIDTTDFDDAAGQLLRLMSDPQVSERCRAIALRHLNFETIVAPRVVAVYERLLEKRLSLHVTNE